jgi:hypothetical protein
METVTIVPRSGRPAHHSRKACSHQPPCPAIGEPGQLAARIVASHPEQGWNLLCNGIIVFDDTGAIAGNRAIEPQPIWCGR